MPKVVDHQQRRQHIANKAAQMIATVGLEKTSIREIAKASGFSKGIVEHYFDSKEDLIDSALEAVNQLYIDRVEKAVGTHKGLAAIEIRLKQNLPLTEDVRQEWKIRLQFWNLAALDPRFQAIQSQRFGRAKDSFLKDIRAAQSRGEVCKKLSATDAANKILFTLSGVCIAALHSPQYVNNRRLLRSVDDILRDLTD